MNDRYGQRRSALLSARERALLGKAKLPGKISGYLKRIIQESTLSDEERLDLLRELVAHFEDGLRSGRASEELVGEFGDARVASRELSEARRRRGVLRRGWPSGLEGFLQDLKVAVRGLWKSPAYAGIAILTLGLGIGANTAVFSVVNGVVLKPLPYHEPDRLVALFQADARGATRLPWSVPNLRELEGADGALASVVGYGWRDLTLTGVGNPRLMNAVAVSGGLLDLLGVHPELGRDITQDETLPGGPRQVVVSQAFWKESLGGDTSILGRTLQLSGMPYEIVGVAPEGFQYPRGAELWVPGQWDPQSYPRGRMTLRVVGRLAPGATLERARQELSAFARHLAEAYPNANAGVGANILSLEDYQVGGVRTELMVLLGAVAMVLLIACVNVANLVLVRGANRGVEIAVRSSLGAGRGALLRQLMTENLVLSLTGAALGVFVAWVGVSGLLRLAAGRIPRMHDVSVNGTVLGFAAATAVAAALIFGLVPALRLSRTSISQVVRGTPERAGGGRDRSHARSALIAVEVGLSLVLLVGAGLLLRSFAQIRDVALGFEPADVREFDVTLPAGRYDDEQTGAFFGALRERLAALPGVESVGLASGSPLGGQTGRTITVVGEPTPPPGQEPIVLVRWVSPGYTETLRVPLLRGRRLADTDRAEAPRVALIGQSTADRYLSGANPLGRQFRFTPEEQPWTVVGVVGDVRALDVTEAPEPEVYVPLAQWSRRSITVMLRTARKVPGLDAAIRREVHGLDPLLAIYNVGTLDQAVASSSASQRFYLVLLAIFAGLAVVLAAVGLYGVISYIGSGRTREIGVRIALGAHPGDIARMVAGSGAWPVLVGIIAGIAGAMAMARFLGSLLYQIDPWDPLTFMGGAATLVIVAAVACWLPARKASRTTPTEAMRVS